MKNSIDSLITDFEKYAHTDDAGVQFWYARELALLLDYPHWQKFVNVINKSEITCQESGFEIADHFNQVVKMVDIGSGAQREQVDYKLTRYACYLIAQNGDSRKKPVAFAQTYFAIQTRRKELEDQALQALSPEEKRILLRNELKTHNKSLADAAKGAGVIKPLDYAIFQNHGYQGLYAGLNRQGIQAKKGLSKSQDILDHMGSEELAANLFRATQAEAKLKREGIKGKKNANQAHFEVGKKVRETIQELGGTMPENLPVEEDVKKVERRVKAVDKKSLKGVKGLKKN
jgi:DNA-damage-inducible protein D